MRGVPKGSTVEDCGGRRLTGPAGRLSHECQVAVRGLPDTLWASGTEDRDREPGRGGSHIFRAPSEEGGSGRPPEMETRRHMLGAHKLIEISA